MNERPYRLCNPVFECIAKIKQGEKDAFQKETHQEKDIKEYTKLMKAEFQFLSYVPIVFLSAKTKKRIHTLMPEIKKVYNNSLKEVKTSVLNDVIRDAVILNQPPSYKGKRLKIYFVNQIGFDTINQNPQGTLCSMEKDGTQITNIAENVKNYFYINNNKIY